MGRRVRIGVACAAAILAVAGPPAPAGALTSEESTLLALVARARAERGLPPLKVDAVLSRIARAHSAEMAAAGRVSHSSGIAVAGSARYPAVAENVGAFRTVGVVHVAFMRSEGHRRAVLDPGWRLIGVGVVEARGGYLYVTELFGGGWRARAAPARAEPPPAPQTVGMLVSLLRLDDDL